MRRNVTRRNFLAASAVTAGLLGLAGCESASTKGGSDVLAAPAADAYPIDPEEWGSGTPKHAEEVIGTERGREGWTRVTNERGATLGVMDPDRLIQVDGFAFKDLNGNGKLDLWEDWRQPAAERARAQAAAMDAKEALALMLHVSAFSLEMDLEKHTTDMSALGMSSDAGDPKTMAAALDLGIRTMLQFGFPSADPKDVVKWNNVAQAYVEGKGTGVPVNISNNPIAYGFPVNLGLAATFDPELIKTVASEQAKAYRAQNICTLLGPQMDLATEPRWARISSTFGEDPALVRDLTNAYVTGLQSTFDEEGADLGWGKDSVVGMIKHFPGDGCGESGREAHNEFGKFCVYPGNNMAGQLIPFVDGGLHLESATGQCGAFMDSYSIAYSDTEEYGELVGSAFSKWKNDLLREKCDYDGLICTDWGIVEDTGTHWGVEDMPKVDRYVKVIESGLDQIGGYYGWTPLTAAYNILVEKNGADATDERVRTSARRVLNTIFETGLSDCPYLSSEESLATLGGTEMAAMAEDVTNKSIVMLKNAGGLIKEADGSKPKVYVPMKYANAASDALGNVTPGGWSLPFSEDAAAAYFDVVTDTLGEPTGPSGKDGKATYTTSDIVRATAEQVAECDRAIVVVDSPKMGSRYEGGFDKETQTYKPIPLQYGEYVADGPNVREVSVAGDIIDGEKQNRTYMGQSAQVINAADLAAIKDTVTLMGEKPVVVCVNAFKAMVVSEFEPDVAAIFMGFGTKGSEFLNVISGKVEPSGLLPMQMPASMDTVEAQLEDVPRDMECHVDTEGNEYDFGYGLNWSGVISDARTEKYCVEPLTKPEHIEL